MLIPEKLKLNKFKLVKIPSNADYFGRVGLQSVGTPNLYTGDEIAVMPQNKIDQILEADQEYKQYLRNPDGNSKS